MRVQIEVVVQQDLEDGCTLRVAGCVVELGVQRSGRQVEALAEAPGEDWGLVGLHGFHGDGFQDWGAGWECGEVGLYEEEVAVCGCGYEQLGEVVLGCHGEAGGRVMV